MVIEQIYTGNAYRNFHYLIACADTGEALAVDPLEADLVLAHAAGKGWRITQVLNTHEHADHTGGNARLIAATGAKLLAHAGAKARIPGIDRGLEAGDVIAVGKTVELEVLDTPGHTMSHVCLYCRGERPALISGDTLFNAGAGNCHHGGHPESLYHTFVEQLARLPDDTRVLPGHDYIANNLRFTLDREPDNVRARTLLAEVQQQDPHAARVTTLGEEKEINTFFRLGSRSLIARLQETFPDLPSDPSPKEVFLHLRALRNKW